MRASWTPIPPVAGERPFWSVMIPTYNGDELLAHTLRSVLEQDPGPSTMQIEVVDDRSTRTDPERVVRDIAGDRIAFHRQPRNVGPPANYNTCLQRARGHVVHLLHDDDYVRPGFYTRLGNAFRSEPSIGAAFVRHIYTNPDGHWTAFSSIERPTAGVLEGWARRIASGQRLVTPSIAVRRSVYEELGGFDERLKAEDWEMWVRIATRYPVWFEPEPLAVYRTNRPGSQTADMQHTTAMGEAMLRSADVIESYLSDHLPAAHAEAALRRARAEYIRWVLEAVGDLFRAGEWEDARNGVRLAVREGTPAAVAKGAARVAAKAAVNAARQARRRAARGQ